MRTTSLPFINYERVGQDFKKLLKQKGVSQPELAKKAGIHQSGISRFISTGRGISADKMLRIAEILSISLEDLYGVKNLAENIS